jgi:MFS family permease
VSLLITFGAFGRAYFVRPLGAIVVGGFTDRAGRKARLLLSIALMMIGTTLMAVMPSYATIGIAAPIIITLARLLQGVFGRRRVRQRRQLSGRARRRATRVRLELQFATGA